MTKEEAMKIITSLFEAKQIYCDEFAEGAKADDFSKMDRAHFKIEEYSRVISDLHDRFVEGK